MTDRRDLEAEALGAWQVHDPGPGFAEAVLDRLAEQQPQRNRGGDSPLAEVVELADFESGGPTTVGWKRWAVGALAASVALVGAATLFTAEPDMPPAKTEPSVAATVAAQTAPPAFAADIRSYLGQYGKNYGPAFRFHGIVAVARDGQRSYIGHGETKIGTGERPDGQTRFRIGAMTQPMVAVAMLRLVERGQLRLDERLAALLPTLPWPSREITVEQLLMHRSGLAHLDDERLSLWAMTHLGRNVAQALVADILRLPLQGPPGSAFAANNANYMILGLLLSKLTGLDLDAALAREVFEPAGMTATSMAAGPGPGETGVGWAQGHQFVEEERLMAIEGPDSAIYGGAGGLSSTAEDLLRFAEALHDGRLLSADMLRKMQTPAGEGFAMGWAVRRMQGMLSFGHPGAIDGYNGSLLRFADGTAVVVLMNSQVIDATRVVDDLCEVVFEGGKPQRIEPSEVPMPKALRRELAGDYVLSATTRRRLKHAGVALDEASFGRIVITEQAGGLWLQFPGREDKRMYFAGAGAFFFKDRPQSRARILRSSSGALELIEFVSGSSKLIYAPKRRPRGRR